MCLLSDKSLAELSFSQRTLQSRAVGYEDLVQPGLAFSSAMPLKLIFPGNLHYSLIQGEASSLVLPWGEGQISPAAEPTDPNPKEDRPHSSHRRRRPHTSQTPVTLGNS